MIEPLPDRERYAVRGGEANPDPGEPARTERRGDSVELRGRQPGSLHDPLDHREQRLGMTMAQRPAFRREHRVAARDCRRAGRSGGFDREKNWLDREEGRCAAGQMARTSVTSGM